MNREELRAISDRHGGTRAFAARLRVSQRIVQMWVAEDREVRPLVEDRIRSLKPLRKRNRKEHP
jgi:hypothetical protein